MVDNENCFHLEMIDVESIFSLHSPLGLPPPASIPAAGGFFYHAAMSALFTSTFTLSISSVYVAAFDMPVSCSLSAAPDAGDFTSVNGVPVSHPVPASPECCCFRQTQKPVCAIRYQRPRTFPASHSASCGASRSGSSHPSAEEGHQHVVAFLCQRHSLRQGRQLPVNAQGKLIRHQ